MIIESVDLQNYRNYEFLNMTFDNKINIIYGDNAQGKTNILESLYVSGTTKSHKGSKDKEMIRFGQKEAHINTVVKKNEMEYEIDIPEELNSYILPKLTLQPLVENALYHGIKIRRRKGLIRVSGRTEGTNLILEVADDGSGMSPERLEEVRSSLVDGRKEGFGMRTVHQRIQILFGQEFGLTLESTPDVGTKIFVKIPMQTSEKEMGT